MDDLAKKEFCQLDSVDIDDEAGGMVGEIRRQFSLDGVARIGHLPSVRPGGLAENKKGTQAVPSSAKFGMEALPEIQQANRQATALPFVADVAARF